MSAMTRLTKLSLATGAAAAALAIPSSGAFAQAREKPANAISIKSQDLDDALRALARQAGIQILFNPSNVAGRRAPRIAGATSPEHALRQMLSESGLRYRSTGPGAYTILAQVSEQRPTASASREAPEAVKEEVEESVEEKEIVVTAQRREESLQDVPVSISVLSGQRLDSSPAQGLTELLGQTPGVAVNQSNQGGGTSVIVRGVSAGGELFSGSSPVSYYLDSVPFGLIRQAIAPDLNPFDLDRVEVLRGPQGTLYGASSQNGVVRVITRDADLVDFEGKSRMMASSTEDGGINSRVDLALNVPIVEERLGARVVLGYQDLSGWIDRPNRKDANDAQIANWRVKLNAAPTSTLSLGASVWGSRSDFGGPSISADNGIRNATRDEPMRSDFDLYSFRAEQDFGWGTLTSSTGYLKFFNDIFADVGGLLPGYYTHTSFDADVFSQEVSLSSNATGPWRWSVGAFYRDVEELHFAEESFGAPPWRTIIQQHAASTSGGVFGDVTRTIGKFELTAGLRYFRDSVETFDELTGIRGDADFEELSPRVVVAWHPSEDLMTYASYSEGFRSGMPQAGLILGTYPDWPALQSDTLHNYELGAKGSLWSGRLQFDASLYFIDWKGVQQSLTVPVPTGGFAVALVNSGNASGLGVDIGLTFRPTRRFTLGLTTSWNNLNVDQDVLSSGVVLFDKGDRLNTSPEWVSGASADYTMPLANGYRVKLAASANYTSALDKRTIASGAQSIARGDDIFTARSSVALVAPDHWTLTVFAENITNENGAVVRFPILPTLLPWHTRVRPRTFGLQLEYNF